MRRVKGTGDRFVSPHTLAPVGREQSERLENPGVIAPAFPKRLGVGVPPASRARRHHFCMFAYPPYQHYPPTSCRKWKWNLPSLPP